MKQEVLDRTPSRIRIARGSGPVVKTEYRMIENKRDAFSRVNGRSQESCETGAGGPGI